MHDENTKTRITENGAEKITSSGSHLVSESVISEKYRVISVLGEGGMGTVYKVEQVLLKKPFALKTLRKDQFSDVTWRRFQKEAQALSKFDHPNLVKSVDFGLIDGNEPYLVMDLAEGESLSERIKRKGPLELQEFFDTFIPVCFGLEYAHGQGIIHRDLKPSNIMLTTGENGHPKPMLVDFGIAKLTDADVQATLTRTGEVFGTPYYMSPEQGKGERVDARSDIYSLGCVMFEALTGVPPYHGDSAIAILSQHMSGEIPSLKETSLGREFPEALEEMIHKMLAKEPAERYNRADQVARALIRLQRHRADDDAPQDSSAAKKRQMVSIAPKRKLFERKAVAVTLSAVVASVIGYQIGFLKGQDAAPKATSEETAAKPPKVSGDFLLIAHSEDPLQSMPPYSTKYTINGEQVRRFTGLPRGVGLVNWVHHESTPQTNRLHWPNIAAVIDPSACAADPRRLLRFRADDLTEVRVLDGQLTGDITDDLANDCMAFIPRFESVDSVCIGWNRKIDDRGLSYLQDVKNLRYLDTRASGISAQALARMSFLPKLKRLYMGTMPHIDLVLNKLAASKNELITLGINQATLTAADLRTIASLKLLEGIDVSNTTGHEAQDLYCLTSLPHLVHLNLSPQANDEVVKHVASRCRNLRVLKLDYTKISDEALDAVAQMPELKELSLRHTQLTNKAIAKLSRAKNLEKISIDGSTINHEALPYLLAIKSLKAIDDMGQWSPSDKATIAAHHIEFYQDEQITKPRVSLEAKMGFFDTVLEKGQSSLDQVK